MSTLKKGKYLALVLMVSVTVLIGCVSAVKPPKWITTLYDHAYSEKNYICAVGSGSTRENAINAAFAALSQTFNTQVESMLTYLGYSSAETKGGGETIFYDNQAMLDQSRLTSKSDRIVGGEVVNTYVDENQSVWVRVAVNRQKSAQIYTKEMGELVREINTIKKRAQGVKSPLLRYFQLLDAQPIALEHLQLAQQVSLLIGKTEKTYLHEIRQELDDLAATITLALEVEVETPQEEQERTQKEIIGAFRALFNDFGFKVGELDERGIPRVKIAFFVKEDENQQGPYVHVHYSLSVTIEEAGKLVGSYQKGQRETALSAKEARYRALRSALNQGVEGFKEALK
ncbi:MAG: LPP20 family lipoprotein [Sphaerochaetaceae bacterium]